ncbi:hypothetical protein J6590_033645 [Homalodisca vitripennis]|nr:hypothetical protein J6590_033645 [Homalodisca vitripennis]
MNRNIEVAQFLRAGGGPRSVVIDVWAITVEDSHREESAEYAHESETITANTIARRNRRSDPDCNTGNGSREWSGATEHWRVEWGKPLAESAATADSSPSPARCGCGHSVECKLPGRRPPASFVGLSKLENLSWLGLFRYVIRSGARRFPICFASLSEAATVLNQIF